MLSRASRLRRIVQHHMRRSRQQLTAGRQTRRALVHARYARIISVRSLDQPRNVDARHTHVFIGTTVRGSRLVEAHHDCDTRGRLDRGAPSSSAILGTSVCWPCELSHHNLVAHVGIRGIGQVDWRRWGGRRPGPLGLRSLGWLRLGALTCAGLLQRLFVVALRLGTLPLHELCVALITHH